MKVHPGLKLELVTIYCKQGGCKRPPNSAPHSSGPLRSYMSWRESYNLGQNKMEQPTPIPPNQGFPFRRRNGQGIGRKGTREGDYSFLPLPHPRLSVFRSCSGFRKRKHWPLASPYQEPIIWATCPREDPVVAFGRFLKIFQLPHPLTSN